MLANDRPTFYMQWLLATLRWLFLVSAVVVIAIDPMRDLHARFDFGSLTVLLVAIATANILLVILEAMQSAPQAAPRLLGPITLVVDCIVALALYISYGGASTPLLFIGLLPVVVSALRFNWTFTMLTALVMAAGFIAAGVLVGPLTAEMLGTLAANGVVLLLSGLVLLYAARQVRHAFAGARDQAAKEETYRIARARERARAIYDMASTLSATLNYERVLETALEVSELGVSELTPGGATRLVSMVLLFQNDQLRIVASRHLTRSDVRAEITGQGALIRKVLQSAEAVLSDDITQDGDLSQIVALHDCQSVVALPLRAGFENYGVVVFGSPAPRLFGDEQLELFNAVANQATIALQNARLYQSLLEEKERIIEVDEDARKKLARDLHDGPTQTVAAIAMRTNFTLRLLEREPQKAEEELRKIEELARQTTREMRHMLFTLRPLVLESQGLTAALQQLCEKLHETYGLNVTLEAAPFEHRVEAAKHGVAFYIVEEALGNARKHAQAQHIWVRLGLRGDLFVVQIEDDGVGFDVDGVDASYDSRGSLGMVNMRERAALVNGRLFVESAPGRGTRITMAVPLTQEAQEHLHHSPVAPADLSSAFAGAQTPASTLPVSAGERRDAAG